MTEQRDRAIVWWVIILLVMLFWWVAIMLAWPWLAVTLADEQRNDRWFGPTHNDKCCVIIVQEPIPRNKMEREILRINPNAKLFRTRRHYNDRCSNQVDYRGW